MRVLLLSRYARLGASSRLRSFQYLPYLSQTGIDVMVEPLFGDDYVAGLYSGNISKLAVFKAYFSRIRQIFKARQFDVVWLEYEMLPWLPAWIELVLLPKAIPLVVDYDDAVFHRYDQHRLGLVRAVLGKKIDAVMKRADIVMAGNAYLASRAERAGARRIELMPTVVDATRYEVTENRGGPQVTIGWIGQPSTAKYLVQLMPVLERIVAKHSARVVAIGPKPDQFKDLPVDVVPWTEESEASGIGQFDIGIMPLSDSLWERGKCGYKLIQYMACGKPVVAPPVGVNCVIVQHGVNGYLANTDSEWGDALDKLCADAVLRKRMGEEGRRMMEQHYSLQVAAPQLADILRSAARMGCEDA